MTRLKLCINQEGTSRWMQDIVNLPDEYLKGNLYLLPDGCFDRGTPSSLPARGYFVGKVHIYNSKDASGKRCVQLKMNGVSAINDATDILKSIEFEYDVFASFFRRIITIEMMLANATNVEKYFHDDNEHEVWKVLEMYYRYYRGVSVLSNERTRQFCYASSLEGMSDYCFALVLNPHANKLLYKTAEHLLKNKR